LSEQATWRVRVVLVNYNGGDMVVQCLEHLLATDWPADALDVVVVDNASVDGSPEELAARFPQIDVVRSPANLGLAGGANLGMRDLDGVDAIALLNTDAFVEPGWLRPLVDALASDPAVGVANAKLVFEPVFVEATVDSETFVPGTTDSRQLGVRVSGVRVDGRDCFARTHFRAGFHPREPGNEQEPGFHWSSGPGRLWAPLAVDQAPPKEVALRVSAEREKKVEIGCGARRTTAVVGPAPTWLTVEADGERFDVIQNAGSLMVGGGHGADRGFWEQDEGQYDEPTDVVAWCGAAVLLSTRYLADVGLFDGDYFMYYEDFDLSWRGRARGWRYRYVPDSRVRHRHAATAVEGSPMFEHYVHRNRLLTLVKNAPAGMVARELVGYGGEMLRFARGEVLHPLLHRDRPRPHHLVRRARSAAGFARHLPHALAQRREIARGRTASISDLVADRVPQEVWLSQPRPA
jgi:GT2 family glycosyltransferase